MARYKHTEAENGQGLFLTVNLQEQLLPETFEYMLNDLIGKKIDISIFDDNYTNDETGSKAIPPAVLIKLIIYGYSKGIKSSRKLMDLAKENIIVKALTGDMEPHWTTIANFISGNSEKFQEVFVKVLAYCNELGLIGGETFAIDGCRLPSNASMEMSGTKEELEKKLAMYRKMTEKHIAKHQKQDESGEMTTEEKQHYEERQKQLSRQVEKIDDFLKTMEKKKGQRGDEIKSNVTDNESAMIKSSSGCFQGYIGIAVSDKKNQIIMHAEAVGSATEVEYLPSLLDGTLDNMKEAAIKTPEGKKATLMGDANYFSEKNLNFCQEREIEAIIPDNQHKKRLRESNGSRFEAVDFKYHEDEDYYECPNGKRLNNKGIIPLLGRSGKRYQASVKDCRMCSLNSRCIKTKKKIDQCDKGRQLFITERNEPGGVCVEMRKKLSTNEYQDLYAFRIQIIEPVFANIKYAKGLNRFMLRGKKKVNGQWKLYCIVHNLSKCLGEYNQKRDTA